MHSHTSMLCRGTMDVDVAYTHKRFIIHIALGTPPSLLPENKISLPLTDI